MLSTCAQAFALELQTFSLLPFQQTTALVEKPPAQNVTFEELIIHDEIHDLLRWADWVISKQCCHGREPTIGGGEQERVHAKGALGCAATVWPSTAHDRKNLVKQQ